MNQQPKAYHTNPRFQKQQDSYANVDVDIFRFNELYSPSQSNHLNSVNSHFPSYHKQKSQNFAHINQNQQTRKKFTSAGWRKQQNQNNNTRENIRMKVVLQNKRLKQNIHSLAKDLEEYQQNQLKISEVLKQSKQKILSLKNKLKQKSNKIRLLAQENIALRTTHQQLQDKISTLNSFSQWQQKQNKLLLQQMTDKTRQIQELTGLKAKIQHFQMNLKRYESGMCDQLIYKSQKKRNEEDNFQLIVINSQQSLKQQDQRKSFSLKQIEAFDIDGLKHKENDTQQIDKLQDMNSNLKNRLSQVQLELCQLKSQISDYRIDRFNLQESQQTKQLVEKERQKRKYNDDKELKKTILALQQKQQTIKQLQRKMSGLKKDHYEAIQQKNQLQQRLRLEVRQLYVQLQIKQKRITQLNDIVHDNTIFYRAQFKQLQSIIELKATNLTSTQQDLQHHRQLLQQRQHKIQQLTAKVQQLLLQKQDNQVQLQNIQTYLYEKAKAQLKNELLQQNQLLKFKHELVSAELNEARLQIQELKKQKLQYTKDMEIYARQIRQLNLAIMELNKDKQRSNSFNSQQVRPNPTMQGEDEFISKSQLTYNQHRLITKQYSQMISQSPEYDEHNANDNEFTRIQLFDDSKMTRYKLQNNIKDQRHETIQLKQTNKISLQQQDNQNILINKISILNQQITDLTLKNNFDIQQFRQQQVSLLSQIHQKAIQLSNFQQTNLINEKTITNLNINLNALQQQLHKCESTVNELRLIIQNDKFVIDNLQGENNAFKAQLKQVKQSQLLLTNANKECLLKIVLKQKQIQRYQQLMMSYKQDQQRRADVLRVQIQEKRIQLQTMAKLLQATSINSQQNQNKLRLKLQQKQQQLSKAYNMLQVSTINLKILQNQINQYQTNNKSLEKSLFQSTEMKIKIEEEISVYKIEKQNLTGKLSVAMKKMQDYTIYDKNKNDLFEQKVKQLQRIREKQQEEIRVMDIRKEEIAKDNERLNQIINQKNKQFQTVTEAYTKQKNKYIKQSLQFQAQTERLNQQIDYLIQEGNTLKDKISSLEQVLHQKHSEKETIQGQISLLRIQLQKKDKMIRQYSYNIGHLKNSLSINSQSPKQTNSQQHQIKKPEPSTYKMQQQQQIIFNDVDSIKIQVKEIQNIQRSMIQNNERERKRLEQEYKLIIKQKDEIVEKMKLKMGQMQMRGEQDIKRVRDSFNEKSQFCKLLQISLTQYQHKLTLQQQKIKQLKQQQIILLTQLQNHKQQNIQHKLKINQLQLKLKDLQANIIRLTEQLQFKHRQLSLQQKDKQNRLLQLKQTQQKVKEYQQIIINKNNVIELNANKINSYELICWQKQNELKQLKAHSDKRYNKLQEDLAISKKIMLQTQEQYEDKFNKINKELSQHKILLRQLQRQKQNSIQQSFNSIRVIKQDLKLKEQFIKQKDDLIVEHKQKVQKMRQQLQQLKINFSKHKKQKEDDDRSIKQLEQQLIQLNEQRLSLKQQINAYDNKAQKMNMQKQQLQQRLIKAQRQLNDLDKEKDTMKGQMSKMQIKYKQKLQDIYQLQNQINRLKQYNQSQKTQIQLLNLQKQDFLKIIQNKQEQNHNLQQKNLKQKQQIQKLANNQQKLIIDEQNNKDINIKILNLQQINNQLKNQIQKNLKDQKLIHKNYQTKIQNIYLEKRQHLLEIEKNYQLQLQKIKEELNQFKQRKYEFQQLLSSSNSKEIQLLREIEKLKQGNKKEERHKKQFETEIGELTDKIIQFTQENNELNQIIENLRNSNIAKSHEIERYHDAIQKMHEQIDNRKTNECYDNSTEEYIKFSQSRKQEYLLKESTYVQQIKELQQKCQKLKQKDNRQRNSSMDSFISRSKIFDEKNNKILVQYEELKNKLQFAEAYITELEDQCQQQNQSKQISNSNNGKREIEELKRQNNDLKLKIEEQQAYINQLQSFPENESVKSRKNSVSKKDLLLQVPIMDISNSHVKDENISKKINLLINFVQNYTKQKSIQQQQQIKGYLQSPFLQQLLSTIIYRIEKQINLVREKEAALLQLQQDYEILQEQLRYEKTQFSTMLKKNELFAQYYDKYQQAQHLLQEAAVQKIKKQADIAQLKTYIHSIQKKYQLKDSDRLQVLQQQNQQDDQIMDQDIDSQIPSSIGQSKQLPQNYENTYKNFNKSSSARLVQKKSSLNKNESHYSTQFLKLCLFRIEQVQKQLNIVQRQLKEKMKLLQSFQNNKINLIQKLDTIQSKIQSNNIELKNQKFHQNDFIKYCKDFLQYLEEHDQYGLQNQKRKKINDFILSMESTGKNQKKSEEDRYKNQDSKKSEGPSKIKLQLHEIKEDVVNENKGYSIAINSQGGDITKYSYNQTGVSSKDINELRQSYNEAIKQTQILKQDLKARQYTTKIMVQGYKMIQTQVFSILDEMLNDCEDIQYFEQQISQIKSLISSFGIEQCVKTFKFEKKSVRLSNSTKMLQKMEREAVESDFQKTFRMNESQFKIFVQSYSNDNLKEMYLKIQNVLNARIQESLQFLNNEKQLISDILKIKYESDIQFVINKLAIRLTKVEIIDIISNSYNQLEAQAILNQTLNNNMENSKISAQDDFSPNIDKIQEIKNKLFTVNSQLSLQLHNKLLEILGAPTRKQFYDTINQFYKIIKEYEERYQGKLSQIQQKSQRHSNTMRKLLDNQMQDDKFENFDHLQVKGLKIRSGSCNVENLAMSIEDK